MTYECMECGDRGERFTIIPTVSPNIVSAFCRPCGKRRLHIPHDGEALRDAGIAKANANPTQAPWRAIAITFLDALAATGVRFTADDVTTRVGVPTESPNAVGALIAGYHRRGRIRPVGYQKSERPGRHAGLVRVWEGVGHGR